MSKSDSWESDLLKLLFQATAVANIADNAATSPLTNLFVSLHTSDPGETGTQTTNETSYTNYARQSVARTSGGWTLSGTAPTQIANAATISFPQCGVTGATITHFGIGTLVSGAGKLLYSGALSSSLAVSQNITPTFNAGALTVTED